VLSLTEDVWHEMVGHAYGGLPDEACGLLAGDPATGAAVAFYPCRNAAGSSRVYTVDPRDHLRADRDAEGRGLEIIGVMHSHTHTEAYPSPTDVAQAPDPAVALRDRVAQARVGGAALVPDRRWRDLGGGGPGRRSIALSTSALGFLVFRSGCRCPVVEPSRACTMAIYSSILDLIGNTPMVDVSPLSPNPRARILAKLEGQNPAGSIKDRIAWRMVREAEADGTLTPGRTIVEPSSGNTGIALAMIARIRGYPIKIVMPENVSIERRQALEVWGAEIITTAGAEGSNGAVRHAEGLANEHPEWAFLYQYANEANPRAHYEGTGPEIWQDCPEITHFVAGLGTTGTLMGVGRFLKEMNPDVKVVAVEPPLGERVEGLRNLDEGYIPPVYDKWGGQDLLDRKRIVRPRESIEWTRRLTEVGVFSGISGGAALAGAAKVAGEIDAGTIVVILADGGWKYLSTGAWTGDIDEVAALAENLIVF
jgi:cysteine synthase B